MTSEEFKKWIKDWSLDIEKRHAIPNTNEMLLDTIDIIKDLESRGHYNSAISFKHFIKDYILLCYSEADRAFLTMKYSEYLP